MDLNMGSQFFKDVQIPLLWGSRAVIQDQEGRLSIIDLGEDTARIEIVGDEPAPDIEYKPTVDGIIVMYNGKPAYIYNADEKQIINISIGLPDCQIRPWEIRVGTNVFSGNIIAGFGVGIKVTENGIAMGAPLPLELAKLVV